MTRPAFIGPHYENNYGGAVRTLNAVRSKLAELEAGAPGYRAVLREPVR